MKKKVLIVSKNFSGGGLEYRINKLTQQYSDFYDFSLITDTPVKDMKMFPEYMSKLYNWNEHRIALKNVEILDIHPFHVLNIFNEWNIDPKIKTVYTLHGQASVEENMKNFLKHIDIINCVSTKLIEMMRIKYPMHMFKLRLSKNYYDLGVQNKKVLISVTNLNYIDDVKTILEHIPADYKVYCIGDNINKLANFSKEVIYEGFVNVKEYLIHNNYEFAITRGGYAAMDIINSATPTGLIYERSGKIYFNAINRNNFLKLSNQNFVTWKIFKEKDFKVFLKDIIKNRHNYICNDLLYKYNAIEQSEYLFTKKL